MGDIFYNKTVTVYNKTSDDLMGSETWYATVLKNVRLIVTKGANVSNSGLDSADSAKLYVRWDFLPEDTKNICHRKHGSSLQKKKVISHSPAEQISL